MTTGNVVSKESATFHTVGKGCTLKEIGEKTAQLRSLTFTMTVLNIALEQLNRYIDEYSVILYYKL